MDTAEERERGPSAAELSEIWTAIEGEVKELGFTVFPAVPAGDDAFSVEWPDYDWSAYLEVATSAQVPIVYCRADRVGPYDLEQLSRLEGLDLDADGRADLEAARAAAGQVCRVELGFVSGGVLHRWSDETDWFETLLAVRVPGRSSLLFRGDADGEDDADGWRPARTGPDWENGEWVGFRSSAWEKRKVEEACRLEGTAERWLDTCRE